MRIGGVRDQRQHWLARPRHRSGPRHTNSRRGVLRGATAPFVVPALSSIARALVGVQQPLPKSLLRFGIDSFVCGFEKGELVFDAIVQFLQGALALASHLVHIHLRLRLFALSLSNRARDSALADAMLCGGGDSLSLRLVDLAAPALGNHLG